MIIILRSQQRLTIDSIKGDAPYAFNCYQSVKNRFANLSA